MREEGPLCRERMDNSKSPIARCGGSSPPSGTTKRTEMLCGKNRFHRTKAGWCWALAAI